MKNFGGCIPCFSCRMLNQFFYFNIFKNILNSADGPRARAAMERIKRRARGSARSPHPFSPSGERFLLFLACQKLGSFAFVARSEPRASVRASAKASRASVRASAEALFGAESEPPFAAKPKSVWKASTSVLLGVPAAQPKNNFPFNFNTPV